MEEAPSRTPNLRRSNPFTDPPTERDKPMRVNAESRIANKVTRLTRSLEAGEPTGDIRVVELKAEQDAREAWIAGQVDELVRSAKIDLEDDIGKLVELPPLPAVAMS